MGTTNSRVSVPEIHLRGGNVLCNTSSPSFLDHRIQLQPLVNWHTYLESEHAFHLARGDVIPILLDSQGEGQFLVKFEGQLDGNTQKLVSHADDYATNYAGDQTYLVHAPVNHVQSIQHAQTPHAKVIWVGQYDPWFKIPRHLQDQFKKESYGLQHIHQLQGVASSSISSLQEAVRKVTLPTDSEHQKHILTTLVYTGTKDTLEFTAYLSRPALSEANGMIARGQSAADRHHVSAQFIASSDRLFTVRVSRKYAGNIIAYLVNQPNIQLVEERPQMKILHDAL